jgi:hypothetical protein
LANLPLAGLLRDLVLSREVTCANCWHSFSPESVLWVSVHPNLAGEPQLDLSQTAERHQRRFIPERFDVECRALDSYGAPCTQIACPRCRLPIPRASLEMPSVVISLLGAPASGKSVFLTSMIFTMRQEASRFGLRFQDADLNLNKQLTDEEQKMFLHPEANEYRPFHLVVEKTKGLDSRFRTSVIDGQPVSFIPPYTFLMAPSEGHPRIEEGKRLSRLLCLYDNAGEHFQPGAVSADLAMTLHLAPSKGLMYTFDLSRDPRLRRLLPNSPRSGLGSERQDLVMIEAANRIREHAGVSQTCRIPQSLVVVLTKFDVWRSLVPGLDETKPFKVHPGTWIDALDWDSVEQVSRACRDLLWHHCREFVTAAESISETVIFAPVAAVGWNVSVDPETGEPTFQANCQPHGVLVPLLCLLSKTIPRVVPSLRRRQS